MSALLITARLVLTGVFTVSGGAKLLDPPGTAEALGNFGVPGRLTVPLSRLLPAAELLAAALLVPQSTAWFGAALGAALLVVFSTAIAVNLLRGRRPACNCFGQIQARPVSPATLVRNGAFLSPALLVLAAGRVDPGPSAVAWLFEMTAAETALTLLVVLLGVGLVAGLVAIRRLSAGQRQLRETVAVLEQLFDQQEAQLRAGTVAAPVAVAPPAADGVQLIVGALAPDFRATTREDATITLGDMLSLQAPVLLLFVSRQCSVCHELLPSVPEWVASLAGRVSVLAITGGSRTDNAAWADAHPAIPLAFAGTDPLPDRYGAPWVPAAVLIGSDGHIARSAAFGGEAIRTLVDTIRAGQLTDELPAEAVPDFPVHLPDGSVVSRDAVLGEHGAVVLFWSATCPHCTVLVTELRQWQAQRPARSPNLVLIAQSHQQLGDTLGLPYVIDETGQVLRSLRMQGTPWARLIDAHGRLRPFDVAGPVHVRQLLGIAPPAVVAARTH